MFLLRLFSNKLSQLGEEKEEGEERRTESGIKNKNPAEKENTPYNRSAALLLPMTRPETCQAGRDGRVGGERARVPRKSFSRSKIIKKNLDFKSVALWGAKYALTKSS